MQVLFPVHPIQTYIIDEKEVLWNVHSLKELEKAIVSIKKNRKAAQRSTETFIQVQTRFATHRIESMFDSECFSLLLEGCETCVVISKG